MDDLNTTNKQTDATTRARESFSGRLLTDRQFDEAMAIVGIIKGEIAATGAFKEKLGDYAFAFARSQKFDPVRGESIVRDLFREVNGMTMNDMRKQFAEAAEKLTDEQKEQAYDRACLIGTMVENGDKISFRRAFAHHAQAFAEELGITDQHARSLMIEEFRAVEDGELLDWGKDLDEDHYHPQIEAEKAEREAARKREGGSGRGRGRSDSGEGSAPRSRTRGPEMRR